MKEKKGVFRQEPPLELIESILQHLRFTGIQDVHWFTKDELPLQTLELWLPLLEPYYLPCKAKRFLMRTMDSGKVITVLRHILEVIGSELKTCERMVGGHKKTFYQIQPPALVQPNSFALTFD